LGSKGKAKDIEGYQDEILKLEDLSSSLVYIKSSSARLPKTLDSNPHCTYF